MTPSRNSARKLSIRSRAPKASSDATRRVMQSNVGRETTPERRIRSELHRRGLRYLKDARPVPALRCSADLVFRGPKVCVFVDGCYWHGCPRHFKTPGTNSSWWAEKIEANRERDARQTRLLRLAGWRVVRVWEHDLAGLGVTRVAARVAAVIGTRQGKLEREGARRT